MDNTLCTLLMNAFTLIQLKTNDCKLFVQYNVVALVSEKLSPHLSLPFLLSLLQNLIALHAHSNTTTDNSSGNNNSLFYSSNNNNIRHSNDNSKDIAVVSQLLDQIFSMVAKQLHDHVRAVGFVAETQGLQNGIADKKISLKYESDESACYLSLVILTRITNEILGKGRHLPLTPLMYLLDCPVPRLQRLALQLCAHALAYHPPPVLDTNDVIMGMRSGVDTPPVSFYDYLCHVISKPYLSHTTLLPDMRSGRSCYLLACQTVGFVRRQITNPSTSDWLIYFTDAIGTGLRCLETIMTERRVSDRKQAAAAFAALAILGRSYAVINFFVLFFEI